MQYKSFEPGVEVSGDSLGAIIDGFKQYPTVATKHLAKFGLIRKNTGAAEIDRSAWYSLDSWLLAYKGIAEEIGVNSLYAIGKKIPENAPFPPHITDIHMGIQSIDVAYHMNHRKNGVVMFDAATGMMLEGIGHYGYKAVEGERKIVCVCENPYPCDFDRGLVSAVATKFQPYARTIHDDAAPCRKKGADSCTYIITW